MQTRTGILAHIMIKLYFRGILRRQVADSYGDEMHLPFISRYN